MNPHMKKKKTKVDVMRAWGMPKELGSNMLRYQTPVEKGILWYFFSLFVRNRDVLKYGRCISCGREITVETSQAGHFMPADGSGHKLLFDERNVNAECRPCNGFDGTHLLGYAEGLDERYGEGTAVELRALRNVYKASAIPMKDLNRVQYVEKLKELLVRMGKDVPEIA